MDPVEFDISVRDLTEFVHRTGDIGGQAGFQRSNRAVEGIKGHKRIQQSRGSDYRPEVPIELTVIRGSIQLRVVGRVDGVVEGLTPLVEEIKTVETSWTRQPDPVHWAQLRIYAAMLALDKGWRQASLQLTYLELDTNEIFIFREEASRDVLLKFWEETLKEWFSWLEPYVAWLEKRNASAKEAPFPFTTYRAGQRELAMSVYRAVQNRLNLFIEAPTGMGKTLATLYPAIKSLPIIGEGKIFYVTAKTPGRLAAQDALEKLRNTGLHIRSLSLTAKAKICFEPDSVGCDPSTCPYTKGYFDRYKPAMRELLETQRLDRDNISDVAKKHQVCPFELSLDVSRWVDVIVGDFNYVFDPTVMLQRFFSEGKPTHVVLVDEAHNLVDRSRDMYSASLSALELAIPPGAASGKARKALQTATEALRQLLQTTPTGIPSPKAYHRGAFASPSLPETFVDALRNVATTLEAFLGEHQSREEALPWLEAYFVIHQFLQVCDNYDETYRTLLDPSAQTITLFCLDPSKRLAQTLKGLRAAVFFSATLSPLPYFMDVLGGSADSASGSYLSPFRSDQMEVRIAPFDISFQQRDRTMDMVAQAVQKHLKSNPGNHLIYCPSLAYLEQLHRKLVAMEIQVFAQSPSMPETERTIFLSKFTNATNSVGLAVIGGIFAEGIDLPGDQLVGVTVIGVGIPGLSIERDLLVAYFDQRDKPGFDYAYRYPGMQRVLQAVGRLIRSEDDQGAALLVDRRFLEARYEELFPKWWRVVPNAEQENWDD